MNKWERAEGGILFQWELTQVKSLLQFLRDDEGAELAEYAVGTAILVAVALIVYEILGDAVYNKMNAVSGEIDAPPPAP
jgi:Flp pilus assembly pilin Flp